MVKDHAIPKVASWGVDRNEMVITNFSIDRILEADLQSEPLL